MLVDESVKNTDLFNGLRLGGMKRYFTTCQTLVYSESINGLDMETDGMARMSGATDAIIVKKKNPHCIKVE